MQTDPACFIRHIQACTNAVLPGRQVRLTIGASPIGWVRPEHAPPAPLPDATAFAGHVDRLAQAGAFTPRAELFDVRAEPGGAVLATVDRGAIPTLGIVAEGVHLNGLVHRADGLHVWVGKRAADRRLDPGKLDHITAGGIPAGHDPWSTLLKEAREEASLPAEVISAAVPTGIIAYAMERDEGLRRDRLHCYDLVLPDGLEPRPNDDEVVGFTLYPIAEVARLVAHTDAFKFNVAVVLIDLLLRTGAIERHSAFGAAIDHAMARLRSA